MDRAEEAGPACSMVQHLVASEGLVEMTPEVEEWYRRQAKKRGELAEEVRTEAEDVKFELGQGLRVEWLCAQRAGPDLIPLLRRKDWPRGAEDRAGSRPAPRTDQSQTPSGFRAGSSSRQCYGGMLMETMDLAPITCRSLWAPP